MRWIFHLVYDLDPIKVENDDDVSFFLVEQQKMERSLIFVEVVNKFSLVTPDLNHTNAFTSGSESNHLSSTMPALNVNTNS